MELTHEMHEAVFGATWARPESPSEVWAMLLDRVRGLAQGKCAECLRKTDAAPPEGNAASDPVLGGAVDTTTLVGCHREIERLHQAVEFQAAQRRVAEVGRIAALHSAGAERAELVTTKARLDALGDGLLIFGPTPQNRQWTICVHNHEHVVFGWTFTEALDSAAALARIGESPEQETPK